MRNLIQQHLKGGKIILLFVITTVIYVIMLTVTIPHVMSYTANMKLLDMMPAGYNQTYVNSLFYTLGEEGRNAYLFRQIPFDMVYPLLFAISYCLILGYFLNKIRKFNGKLFYVCFLPLFSGIFDYGENIGIITMLNIYPDSSEALVQTTSVFSVLKSSTTTITFMTLLTLLIFFGIKQFKSMKV